MNPTTWIASGHLDSFTDPLLDCKECKTRHRADNLINNFDTSVIADAMSQEEMFEFIRLKNT
jgi:glycyl-tRNA synthetase